MSDIDTTTGLSTGDTQGGTARTAKAKQALGQATDTLKQEAQTFASAAQQRARGEVQKHAQTATKTLGDFANAIRRAGDELAQNDQSLGAQLVRQAADGLESLSRNLADKDPEDLLDNVREFGRRNPMAFIGGAVLVGVALGRFIRASDEGGEAGLADDMGGEAYPIVETSAYATGAEALADDTMGMADEDGAAVLTGADAQVSIDSPVRDDLGGVQSGGLEDSTSVLGVDDDSSERRGS